MHPAIFLELIPFLSMKKIPRDFVFSVICKPLLNSFKLHGHCTKTGQSSYTGVTAGAKSLRAFAMEINSALSAQMILASALYEHHNQQAWWDSAPNSLASILGIDNERLLSFVKEANLKTQKPAGDEKPWICTPVGTWDAFKAHFELDMELSRRNVIVYKLVSLTARIGRSSQP
jgi:hypothetical protein